jgi:hypothetical protein
VLFALGRPPALIGLLLGFIVGVTAVGATQARMMGNRHTVRGSGGARAWLGRFVDPFGAIAAALGGVGWAVPVESGRFRRGPARARLIRTLLAAPVVHLALAALGAAALAGLGHLAVLGLIDTRPVLHGAYGGPLLDLTLLGFIVANLTMGLLHVIPLPPLAAGRILFLLAPETPAWQRARYQLEDNNWGVGILLALSLPLLSSSGSVSNSLTAALARPLLQWAAGFSDG